MGPPVADALLHLAPSASFRCVRGSSLGCVHLYAGSSAPPVPASSRLERKTRLVATPASGSMYPNATAMPAVLTTPRVELHLCRLPRGSLEPVALGPRRLRAQKVRAPPRACTRAARPLSARQSLSFARGKGTGSLTGRSYGLAKGPLVYSRGQENPVSSRPGGASASRRANSFTREAAWKPQPQPMLVSVPSKAREPVSPGSDARTPVRAELHDPSFTREMHGKQALPPWACPKRGAYITYPNREVVGLTSLSSD